MKNASAFLPSLEEFALRAAARQALLPDVDLVTASRRLERPDRACVETNLARKGLWQVGGGSRPTRAVEASGVVGADQLGYVERLDHGPRLGVLCLELMVWLCSRWKELGDPDARRVPLTLEGVAADLGWSDGGHNRKVIAQSLDTLRMATFKARIRDGRSSELRLQTFGLVDRWEVGQSRRAGQSARAGFAVLGDWLVEQLRIDCVTYLGWHELRSLPTPSAKRLYLYLEAERFPPGAAWVRPITAGLLGSLGVGCHRSDRARAGLRRACRAVSQGSLGYRVAVVSSPGGYCLAATRERSSAA